MSITARAIAEPSSTRTLEVVVEEERVNTEYRPALPPADRGPSSDTIASALKEELPDLRQACDGATGEPEAPVEFPISIPRCHVRYVCSLWTRDVFRSLNRDCRLDR
jgi:hypothetical protein